MANMIGEIEIVFDEDAKALLQEFRKSVNYLMDKDAASHVSIDMPSMCKQMTEHNG